MSWFSFNVGELAKNALNEAQKKIDKALDIDAKNDVAGTTADSGTGGTSRLTKSEKSLQQGAKKTQIRTKKDGTYGMKAKKVANTYADDFFAAWDNENSDVKSTPRSKTVLGKATTDVSELAEEYKLTKQKDDEISKFVMSDSDIEVISPPMPALDDQVNAFVDIPLVEPEAQDSDKMVSSEAQNLDNLSDSGLQIEHADKLIATSVQNYKSEQSEPLSAEVAVSDYGVCDRANEEYKPKRTSQQDQVNLSEQHIVSPSSNESVPSSLVMQDQLNLPAETTFFPQKKTNDSEVIVDDLYNSINENLKKEMSCQHDQIDVFTESSVISSCDEQAPGNQDKLSLLTKSIVSISSDGTAANSELTQGQVNVPAENTASHFGDKTTDCEVEMDQNNLATGTSFHAAEIISKHTETKSQNIVDSLSLSAEEKLKDAAVTPTETEDKPSYLSTVQSDRISQPDPSSDASHGSDYKYIALSEKMEVYEQQLMTLSLKNASLHEENDNLRSKVSSIREECKHESEKETADVLKSLQSSENSCKLLQEEKANLVKQFNVLKSQLASRMTHEQVQNAIAEKEESIKGLMEEGEVLAKKHLQQNNLIKKLKSQAQSRETELKSVKEKVESYETENDKLKDELKLARGQGKEQRETSLRISDAYEQRERERQILQEKLAQSEEKQRTLQVNLDGAYKEIGDLHKQIAEQESKLSAEWKITEADILREHELEKKKILSDQEHQRQLLMIQIVELSNSISRAEASAARKEDDHRREMQELRQQIQDSEGRNQDLSDSVSNVTRPLLRQIENLQATHATQQRSWNALEKTLNYRLGEAQTQLVAAQESERLAQSTSIESKSKTQALVKQIDNDQILLSRKENEINTLQKQLDQRNLELGRVMNELEELKTTHKELLHKSRKERLFLENQLQMEKVRSEAERKKHTNQLESFQKERDKLMWSRSEITSISSNQVAETESVSSSGEAFQGTDGFEGHASSSSLQGLSHQLSFDGGRAASMSNILENLQTQVKLKEGEIAQLRGEINMLEKTRSSMAEEIVRLTNLNEDMEGVSKELQDTRVKLTDVEGRYSAILTMYGEKEEENEELKMDLADVKAMYRQQINDLLRSDKS